MSDYAVVNPATGETLATYPAVTDDALESAIATADAAYRTWRDTPVAERAAGIRRVAELHRERRDELAAIIVREMGKPLAAAIGEVDFAADITEYYADQAERSRATSRSTSWATAPPSSGGRPSESSSGSCRGTSRTTRSPGSRRPTS